MSKKPTNEASKEYRAHFTDEYSLDWAGDFPLETFGERAGPFMARRVRSPDGAETIWVALRVTDRHINSSGFCHGGVLLTLADEALGVNAHLAGGYRPTPTVSLQAHFLKAVRPGELLEAYTTRVHLTRTMVFTDGVAEVDGKMVAMMNAVFKIVEPKA